MAMRLSTWIGDARCESEPRLRCVLLFLLLSSRLNCLDLVLGRVRCVCWRNDLEMKRRDAKKVSLCGGCVRCKEIDDHDGRIFYTSH